MLLKEIRHVVSNGLKASKAKPWNENECGSQE